MDASGAVTSEPYGGILRVLVEACASFSRLTVSGHFLLQCWVDLLLTEEHSNHACASLCTGEPEPCTEEYYLIASKARASNPAAALRATSFCPSAATATREFSVAALSNEARETVAASKCVVASRQRWQRAADAAARERAASTLAAAGLVAAPKDRSAIETVDAEARSFLLRLLQQPQLSTTPARSPLGGTGNAAGKNAAPTNTCHPQPVLLLSCSGGSDSTALLHATARSLGLGAATPFAVAAAAAATGSTEQKQQQQHRTQLQGTSDSASGTATTRCYNNSSERDGGLAAYCEMGGVGLRVAAVYFNHRLRDEEVEIEKKHLRAMCQAYGLPLHCIAMPDRLLRQCTTQREEEQEDHPSSRRGSKASPQQLMRNWRRSETKALLIRMLQQEEQQHEQHQQRGFVLTGHHADDQLETIFLKLLRGVHLLNLHGMEPLATISDDSVPQQQASQALGSGWCEDSSNKSCKYLRNAFRCKVLPVLANFTQHAFGVPVPESAAPSAAASSAALAVASHNLETSPSALTLGRSDTTAAPVADMTAPTHAMASRGFAALRRRMDLLHRQVTLLKLHIHQEAAAWERVNLSLASNSAAAMSAKSAIAATDVVAKVHLAGAAVEPPCPPASPTAEAATPTATVADAGARTEERLQGQQVSALPLRAWSEVASEFVRQQLLYRWLIRGMEGHDVLPQTVEDLASRLSKAAACSGIRKRAWRLDVGGGFSVELQGQHAVLRRTPFPLPQQEPQ
ncbi:uncharacterized protein LOC34618318 [Cyclospora cayetanensis]|uniref:Uncharacterized protein LOC34618318 n=1 Tax=Cyclospora cayetanensis TaxID=88456 RepID=A0A6P6RVB7_9EIME|nr:uncharacterized protein LOC34618318 [Cyclospora cayetanensis]